MINIMLESMNILQEKMSNVIYLYWFRSNASQNIINWMVIPMSLE